MNDEIAKPVTDRNITVQDTADEDRLNYGEAKQSCQTVIAKAKGTQSQQLAKEVNVDER